MQALALLHQMSGIRLMLGKFGQPDGIAEASAFLASGAAKNIYGQEIVVNGGYPIGNGCGPVK